MINDIELGTIKRSGLDFKFKLSKDEDRGIWLLVSSVYAGRLVAMNYEHPVNGGRRNQEIFIPWNPMMTVDEFRKAIDNLDLSGIVSSYSESQIKALLDKGERLNKDHPLSTKGHRAPRKRKDQNQD